jgi:hypothetical protein
MTVRELIEFLSQYDGDQPVSVALPGNRIEELERAEPDPYGDVLEGILLWPATVEIL